MLPSRVEFASLFGVSVKVKLKIISLNGPWFVTAGPVSPDPGGTRTPPKSLPAREPAPPQEAALPRMAALPGGASGRLRVAAVVRGSPARPRRGRRLRPQARRHGRTDPPPPRPRLRARPGRPGSFEEFTGTELSWALADTRWAADSMLDLAQTLAVKLPGTYAAFRSGILRQSKVEIIARVVAHLDPDEARAAEALVLDRAGRREKGTQDARVQRWMEDSGNAALMGCELPPADVLAADQRITWWAKQLKKAGLDGDMDQLRARTYRRRRP
jgi:hypothetical protein